MEPGPEVEALVEARAAARAGGDYARADALRAEVAAAGWTIRDAASGPVLEAADAEVFAGYDDVPIASPLEGLAYSVCVAMHGWPEDVRRLVGALGEGSVEVVVVDVAGARVRPLDLRPAAAILPRVIRVEAELGHAEALNVAARVSRGRIVVFAEPSLEFGLDVLDALARELDDPQVGLAGPFGLKRASRETFEPDDGPEVDALEYLFAARRETLARVGEIDRGFRFYRNLDIDFSFQVAADGLSVRRVDCGPTKKHAHRVFEATPEGERERLSRRNYNRFLERWG